MFITFEQIEIEISTVHSFVAHEMAILVHSLKFRIHCVPVEQQSHLQK